MSVRSGSGGGVATDVTIRVVGAQEGTTQLRAVNTQLDGTETSGRRAGKGLDVFTDRMRAAAKATGDKTGALGKLQGAWDRANNWVGKVSASLGKFNFVLGAAGALGLLNMIPNALQLVGKAFGESDAQLARNAEFWKLLQKTIAEVDNTMARAAARSSQLAAAAASSVSRVAGIMGMDPNAMSMQARSQIGAFGQQQLKNQERLNELQARYNALEKEARDIKEQFPNEGRQEASGGARALASRLDRRAREIMAEIPALKAEEAEIQKRLSFDPFKVGGARVRGGGGGGGAAAAAPESGPFQYLGMRQIGSGLADDMRSRAALAMSRAQEAADYEAQFKLPQGRDDGDVLGIGSSIDSIGSAVDRLSPFTQALSGQFQGMADVAGTSAGMVTGALQGMAAAGGTALTNLILTGKAAEGSFKKVAGAIAAQGSSQAFTYAILLGGMAAAAGIIGIPVFGATAGQLAAGAGIMGGVGVTLAGIGRALGASGIGMSGGKSGAGGGGGISDAAPARRDPGMGGGGGGNISYNYNFGGAVLAEGADAAIHRMAVRGAVAGAADRGGLRLQLAAA